MVKIQAVVLVLSILLLSSSVSLIQIPSFGKEAPHARVGIDESYALDSDVYAADRSHHSYDRIILSSPSVTSSLGCFDLTKSSIDKISKLRIGLVKPVFTTSAYATDGFYAFYKKWSSTPVNRNVTADLNLLNVTVSSDCGFSRPLYDFLSSSQAVQCGLVISRNVRLLDDIDVTKGATSGPANSQKFDALILGFTEYVTGNEYAAYRNFVTAGGTVILMDPANFVARVQYSPSSQHVALVGGHGWRSNGKSAWRYSPYEFWQSANTNWVGSNFCCFEAGGSDRAVPMYISTSMINPIASALETRFGTNVFTFYHLHEENHVTNSSDSIIASYPPDGSVRVAAYSHKYKAGGVIHIGIMSDDIIRIDPSAQYFLILSLLYR